MVLLVEYGNFTTDILENVAYAISIETSIIIGYTLHSQITWRYKFKSLFSYFYKLIQFNVVTGISFLIRMGIYYLLHKLGMGYLLNTLIGIFIAISINFLGYNKIVFTNNKK